MNTVNIGCISKSLARNQIINCKEVRRYIDCVDRMKKENKAYILIVEDDAALLESLLRSLDVMGERLISAVDGLDARKKIEDLGIVNCLCILTDYRMPNCDGLQLLHWVRSQDSNLSIILMSAHSEAHFLVELIRVGAADFIEKPFRSAAVRSIVSEAIQRTIDQRHQRYVLESLQTVVDVHRTLNPRNPIEAISANHPVQAHRYCVDSFYFPLMEMGGDFLCCLPRSPTRLLMVGGDLSGHDLRAGFLSAYVQGVVRGMVQQDASLESICRYLNDFLCKDWNSKNSRRSGQLMTSISVVGIDLDLENRILRVTGGGFPAITVYSSGASLKTLRPKGSPLGWFVDLDLEAITVPVADFGMMILCSDGLELMAESMGVQPLTLAYTLMKDPRSESHIRLLLNRPDDVLIGLVYWDCRDQKDGLDLPAIRFPFYQRYYPGSGVGDIDAFQSEWKKSLHCGFPHIESERLKEILVCMREALLNALLHGCDARSENKACLIISVSMDSKTLWIEVSDRGCGFLPDAVTDKNQAGHISLGLKMIQLFCPEAKILDEGRRLVMPFRV
jgi:FixJ family two-component response regulator